MEGEQCTQVEGDISACYLNPDRLNYSGLGFGKCDGLLFYVITPHEELGRLRYYACEKHLGERERQWTPPT